MIERVWVGSAEQTPAGWVLCESLEAFQESPYHPEQIVLDDRAGTFRQTEFLKLFKQSPLARIARVVGPWRAGIGRTDPSWPLVTTRRLDSIHSAQALSESARHPLTGGYDELAAVDDGFDLSGISVDVQLSDPELREMWVDSLKQAGAEIGYGEAEVLITDQLTTLSSDPVARLIVHLRPDPWNANRGIGFQPVRACAEVGADDRLEAYPTEEFPLTLTASVLDSPALVMQRITRALETLVV